MDALPAAERAAADAHPRACGPCAETLASLRRVRDVLAADPVLSSAPPVPFEALEARVRARLRDPAPAHARTPRRAVSWTLAPIAAAAAAVAIAGAWWGG